MKKSRRKERSITKSRWALYATAGAATALAGVHIAEGEIFYSGRVDIEFHPPPGGKANVFIQLDQPGDSINPYLARINSSTQGGDAKFRVYGVGGASVVGFTSRFRTYRNYVSKLAQGVNISTLPFRPNTWLNQLAYNGSCSLCEWNDRGSGYVGFKFNDGTGWRYGWACLRKGLEPRNFFKLLDYAYGDVGEPIHTGQKSSHETVPTEGSLGLLAVSASGLLAWRRSRARKTRAQD